MKRILVLIAAMMLIEAPTFAKKNASATADVKARVIQGLSITKNQDLDFGDIAQGSYYNIDVSDAKAVKMTVSGEALENITITYDVPAVLTNDGSPSNTVAFNAYVKYNTVDNPVNATSFNTGSVEQLNSTGYIYVYFGGNLTPGETQQTGNYSGEFTLNVEY